MKRTHQVLREIDTALDQHSPDGLRAKVDALMESAAQAPVCDAECECHKSGTYITRVDATGGNLVVFPVMTPGMLSVQRSGHNINDLPLPDYGRIISSTLLLSLHACETYYKQGDLKAIKDSVFLVRQSFKSDFTLEDRDMVKNTLEIIGVPPHEIFPENHPVWDLGTSVTTKQVELWDQNEKVR